MVRARRVLGRNGSDELEDGVRVIHGRVAGVLPIVTAAVAAGAAAGSAIVVVIALAAGGAAVVAIRLRQVPSSRKPGKDRTGWDGADATRQNAVPQTGDEVTAAARFAAGGGYVRHGSVLYWATCGTAATDGSASDGKASRGPVSEGGASGQQAGSTLVRGSVCRVDTALPGGNGIPMLSVMGSGR